MQVWTYSKEGWRVDVFTLHGCPKCDGPIYRIPRRSIDRVLSLISPKHRYRCGSWDCGWEGNLPSEGSRKPGRPFKRR